jgi:hypothetical protein
MDTSTKASPLSAINEPRLPLDIVPLEDVSIKPALSSDHASMTDGTLPPNAQPTPTPSIIIIQNNYIAEGGTINIFSSHCTSSSELFTCLTHQITYLVNKP